MIKKILKQIMPQKRRIQLYRMTKRLFSLKKSENYYTGYSEIAEAKCDVFQGYYDVNPFQENKLLFNKTDGSGKLLICLKILDESAIILGKTSAWCWQQGCRLRWLPGKDEAIFWNAWDGKDHYGVIYNCRTGIENRISKPLYDIDSQGKMGASLDFTRLGYMRPGYGYTNASFDEKNDLSEEGIDLVDLSSDTSSRVVTYGQIAAFMDGNVDLHKCYLNHLSFDPTGKNLMFFFVKKGKIHQASLFVYQIAEEKLIPLELKNSVSHYCWISDKEFRF